MPDVLDEAVASAKGTQSLSDLVNQIQSLGFTVASTTQGRHNPNSLHYSGHAADIRIAGKTPAQVRDMMQRLSSAGYHVIDERSRLPNEKVWGGPHIHAQFQNASVDRLDEAVATVKSGVTTPEEDPLDAAVAAAKPKSFGASASVNTGIDPRLDKLAHDIEWHYGPTVLRAFNNLPADKQAQIASTATKYAAEDEVKRKHGDIITRSTEWQALNQSRAGLTGHPEILKVRNQLVQESMQRNAATNPRLRDNPFMSGPGKFTKRVVGTGAAGIEDFAAGVTKHIPGTRDLSKAMSAVSRDIKGQLAEAEEKAPLSKEIDLGPLGKVRPLDEVANVAGGLTSFAPLALAPEFAPESVLAKIGIGAAEFGGYSGLQASGRGVSGKEIAKDIVVGGVTGGLLKFPLPGKNVLTKAVSNLVITGGGTTVVNLASGQPLDQSMRNGLIIAAMRMPELLQGVRVSENGKTRPATMNDIEGLRTGAVADKTPDEIKVEEGVKAGAEKAGVAAGAVERAVKLPEPPKAIGPTAMIPHQNLPQLVRAEQVNPTQLKLEFTRAEGTVSDDNIKSLFPEYDVTIRRVKPAAYGEHIQQAEVTFHEKGGIRQVKAPADFAQRLGLDEPLGRSAPTPSGKVTLPEPPKSNDPGATFQASVLGADKFVQQDVAPVARGAVETVRSLVRALSPRTGVNREAVDTIMGMKGQRDKAQFILEESMKADRKMFDKLPMPERIAFMDRIKTGTAQPTPELQRLADAYRKLDDEIYAEVKKYKPSLTYLDNHFRILWKTIPGQAAAKGFSGLFRRPLQGSKGFLKQHTLDTVSEGINRGGVPISTNPQTLFEMHYADAMKFITAQKMWQGLKDQGLAKFVRIGKPVPDGFTRLSDPLAKVYFPTDAGLVNTGEWYVDEGAGRLLNNHLSRNYVTEAALGKGLLALKNHMTAFELGLSGFHFAFVASESASSKLGLGMRRFVNLGLLRGDVGEAVKGVRDMALAGYAWIPGKTAGSTYKLGSGAFKYLTNKADFLKTTHGQDFVKQFPQADDMLDDLFTGGGKLKMNDSYRTNSARAWSEAVANGNYPGALLRSLPALNETAMRPLFDIYIPRMKVGQFLQEYSLALAEKAPQLQSGELTRAQLARKTWDFVEDRFGEMNFDNLFWDNTFKSAMQIMWRSTTWKLGNMRATGMAIPEQATEVYRAVKGGRAPMLEPKMAWLAGQALITAALGTIVMKSYTNKWPQTLTDLAFPQIDPHDPKRRLSVPTYVRDTLSAYHSPGNYVSGATSAEFSRAMEVWKNRDFKGQYVYDPHDPIYWKAADAVQHFFPVPFSVSNYIEAEKNNRPASEKALGFVGFMKAPSYLTKTAWEEEMDRSLFANVPTGGRSPESIEHSQVKNLLKERIRAGDQSAVKEAYSMQKSHKLTTQETNEIVNARHVNPLQEKFKRLQLKDAERIYQMMPPDAQQQVEQILKDKRIRKGSTTTP